MNYIVDIFLIVVFAGSIVLAARKGFFPTLFDLGSKILAVIGARILSVSLAPTVYSRYFESGIRNAITQKMGSAADFDAAESVQTALDSIPQSLNGLLNFIGLDKQQLVAEAQNADITGKNLIAWLMDNIVTPATTAVCRILLFAAISVVLLIILRLILGILARFIKKLPLLKQADKALGVVLGVLRGVLLVVVAVFALTFIASISKSQGFVDAVSSSKIVEVTDGIITSVSGYIS